MRPSSSWSFHGRDIEYDPVISAYKMEYRRLSTNEVYEGTEYVYTGPLIRLLMEVRFELVQSIRLEHSFVDVYTKGQSD